MLDSTTLQPYYDLLPYFGGTFLISLLITPIIGKIAFKFGFLDLPANLRKRTDPTLDQRMHKHIKPRLGALAALIPFFIIFLTQINLDKPFVGIFLGLAILVIGGIIDDKYELTSNRQFLIQFFAAGLVVLFGTSITSIQVAGMVFDFNAYSHIFSLGTLTYNFIFPADIITVLWILTIINCVNWVCGLDALGELLTFVAAIAITMLSIRSGNIALAILPATLAAGILGYIPYNFPPSKIIGGTAGHTGYGYLIAVLSIMSGAKITSALLLISIPLLDMIWVIVYRLYKFRNIPFLKRPFVSGKVHLHHRLLEAGFTQKQVLFIETSAMAIVSVFTFYLAGFSNEFIALVTIFAVIVIVFTILSIKNRNRMRNLVQMAPINPQSTASNPPSKTKIPPIDDDATPEERYAY